MDDPDYRLEDADVRAMVRLLGEVCAISGSLADKKRGLMDGLCRLVDAEAWAWALATRMDPDQVPVYAGFQHGGFSEEEFAKYLAIHTRPEQADVTAPYARELTTHGRHITRTIQQIVEDEAMWDSPIAKAWEDCGFYAVCASHQPVGGGAYSGIALYRRFGRPRFDQRQARITHIVMSEVPWLHHDGWSDRSTEKINTLSPRLWLVHECLLQSFPRKQIAAHLGISLNTVNGYVAEVFRHFHVQSHTELLHRFYHGNGGDARSSGSAAQETAATRG